MSSQLVEVPSTSVDGSGKRAAKQNHAIVSVSVRTSASRIREISEQLMCDATLCNSSTMGHSPVSVPYMAKCHLP